MNRRATFLCILLVLVRVAPLAAQDAKPATPRRITLEEAVQSALKHNHVVRIAALKVEEKEHTKNIARSAYFPILRNDSNLAHVTDTQFIGIPAGSLGTVSGTAIPETTAILNQGGHTFVTSGTQLTQPLTDLWKIRAANDIVAAELNATQSKQHQTENEVALRVHQIYYRILIVQSHREAAQARIQASEDLQKERVQQVKYGSTLEEEAIESRAQSLEARQDLLTTELQLSDLTMQLDDAMGLSLTTPLVLDASVRQAGASCKREECLRMALESHPEIVEARAEIEKASAAARLAKRQYLPDIEALARYSYQDNVPFLARNFGTFGVHFGFDVFDSGRKRSLVHERQAQLSQAKENLAKLTDAVEVSVQTAYNKLERTQQMLKVSEEVLSLRTESKRVRQQELIRGAALHSQADTARAQEYDAKSVLLQAQLDYFEAHDEVIHAMGGTVE